MNRSKFVLLAAAALMLPLITLIAQSTPAPAANRVALFDPKDLSAWRVFLLPREGEPKLDPKSIWTASADGVLKIDTKAQRGYLMTQKVHGDYHLHVEWRWPKDAATNSNSGVLVHVSGPDAIWPTCYEVEMAVQNAGRITGINLDIPAAQILNNRKRSPRMADPSEKPLGEWNTYDLHARKDTLEVFVNGVRQNKIENLPVSSGYIGLQLEGMPIEYRNVWLEPK